ncbi:hypothetical protein VO71_20145 [Aeromonas salmonicida subsp. smithia]|uniref:DUF805 domain-containing protein n=1 Tax=Aeromonas salmonicida TaxID=645 RepID=UPI0007315DFA|nr:DUF805 domain-containing protein [Aeromonas salmonicida]KTA88023.1 hypothetical protein VO71_20145 [Aeromonas salmonicida subsp. smithia]
MLSFYLLAWRRYFDFSGFSSRKEFWMFMWVHLLVTLMCIALDVRLDDMIWLDMGYGVASAIPVVALVVRRLHDIDRSGWWGCVFFVPVIGPFVLIYFLSQQGDSYAQSARRT